MYKKLYIIIILLSLSIFTEAYGRHGMEMRRKHTEFDKRLGHDPLHFFRKIGITLTGEQEEKIYVRQLEVVMKYRQEIIKILNSLSKK